MKVLIYGLQSSGASLFCYFMAQKKSSIGIIDLNNHRLAPFLEIDKDIVLKAVITTTWPLKEHIENFQPDRTILYLRNPYNNYYSLKDKVYANKSGDIDDKFRLLDEYYVNRNQFDEVITYEDFILDHEGTVRKIDNLGWNSTISHYSFRRHRHYIYLYNYIHCKWCRNNPAAPGHRGGWSMGNITSNRLVSRLSDKPYIATLSDKVNQLCPHISQYYRERYAQDHQS